MLIRFVERKFYSLRKWWSLKRGNGVSKLELIFWSAPIRILRTIYLMPIQYINRYLLFYINKKRLEKFNEFAYESDKMNYYIIVMPHILHMLLPCIKLVFEEINVILIHNGTKKCEKPLLQKQFPSIKQFDLITFPFSSYEHGKAIDLLLSAAVGDFGIFDHDIYIFKGKHIKNIKLEENHIMAYIFSNKNEKTGLLFPTTHFLYFNYRLTSQIVRKYRLSFLPYRRIPKRLRIKLMELGLGPPNYPKSWLNYFDTCQMVQAIALYEKHIFLNIGTPKYDVTHLGGTTHGVNSLSMLFLNALLLELNCNKGLPAKYRKKLLENKDKYEIVEGLLTSNNGVAKIVHINKFIKRLSEH